jgi:hypothetical protein
MKALQNGTSMVERERAMNAIDTCMARLFRRCPELSGFSLVEDGDVCVVDVALQAGYDMEAPREEIVAALFELLDDRPEAFELLRGRTFARTLH